MFYNKSEVIDVKFILEVHLIIEGTRMVSSGPFKARNRNDIPRAAYQYIQEIKRETGFRTTVIEKVIIDGEEDITDKIKEMENRPGRSKGLDGNNP
jgi:hypothetical protein